MSEEKKFRAKKVRTPEEVNALAKSTLSKIGYYESTARDAIVDLGLIKEYVDDKSSYRVIKDAKPGEPMYDLVFEFVFKSETKEDYLKFRARWKRLYKAYTEIARVSNRLLRDYRDAGGFGRANAIGDLTQIKQASDKLNLATKLVIGLNPRVLIEARRESKRWAQACYLKEKEVKLKAAA